MIDETELAPSPSLSSLQVFFNRETLGGVLAVIVLQNTIKIGGMPQHF
jgi:hypothetical protein